MVLGWHQFDGVTPFTARAVDYAQARPAYPSEAVAWIMQQSTRLRPLAVDVGAGTGRGTGLLTQEARFVVGLEPNLSMIRAAPSYRRVGWSQGRGERLPIRSGSVDLVTVFGAFHWFEPDAFLGEAHRVLRSNGHLALAWNDWDEHDPFTSAFVRLMRRYALDRPAEDRAAEVAPLHRSPRFGDVRHRAFPLHHRLDRQGLLARMRSVSYVPGEGPAWEELRGHLLALFDEYAGPDESVTHHYTTNVFMAAPLF
jgi:SAM-dependent methyltransferase